RQNPDHDDAEAMFSGQIEGLPMIRASIACWGKTSLGRFEDAVTQLNHLEAVAGDQLTVSGRVAARAAEAEPAYFPLATLRRERFQDTACPQGVRKRDEAAHRASAPFRPALGSDPVVQI